MSVNAQGNRLSIQASGPKNLSICGLNDTANIEVFNISSGTVSTITIKLILPTGIKYVSGSLNGTGVTESNISNLNQPIFKGPNLLIAKNFKFRVELTADCNLLSFLNSNNTPSVQVRADYTGNFDVGSSIPFSVKVPSAQYGTVSNLSYTGDIGTKFIRTITIGNFGKGPLREIKIKRINGKDVRTYYSSKGSTVYSGDTVVTTFGTSYFKTIGNNDTFLDQNELITFIDSSIILGCKNLGTNFELSWGCGGMSCQVSKLSGSALISNKSPVLKAIPFPSPQTCYTNNTYKTEIRFVNTGNMTAVSPRVGISANYYYVFSTFDTASIRIKVGANGKLSRPIKDSIFGSYNAGYYGCIGLYPIGLFRIKCPDLAPNDTLFVTWDTKTCAPPKCSNASMVTNSWAYYADYKDQCSNLKRINWTWGRVYDQHYCSATSYIPTDLVNNQTGEFRTFLNTASLVNRSSSASYVVDIILPKGLKHSLQKNELYFINSDLTATWKPDSIKMRGDTLRGYFPHPVPINLAGSELVYYLKADCSKTGANGNQNITLQIRYNPDKKCNPNEWLYLFCQTSQLKIHCISNCGGGMKFTNFSVQRVNFGLPDSDNDGKPDSNGTLDTANIREERCMTGDTILAQFHGVIKRTSTIVSWRNAYIETLVTNGKHLDIAGVQLLVWRRGVSISVNCNQIKSWKTITGNNATFKLDLSTDSMQACVSSGFRYNNNDSIVVKVKFRVTGNIKGSIANILFSNRFYTSNVNNPSSNANKFQCDTFSGQMILSGYFFTTCCRDIYQINSCSNINVNNYYYLGIGGSSYGGNNQFPYEYRNFARLKAIRYYIPQGFKLNNAYITQYRTSGSNKTTLEIRDSLKPVNPGSSPLLFNVSSSYIDSSGPINPSDDGFHGYFIAQMEPSCEIQSGAPSKLKYDFIFERRGTLAPGFDTVSSGYMDDVVYNKPVFTIKPVSATIYAAQDTAEWELNFTNYSGTFSNVNTWFSPDNSGAIKVVQIKDGNKDTALPSNQQIFKIGTIGYNTTRNFKVRAIYNSCKKDSVVLYAGWNCSGYPTDLASYPCHMERVVLYLEPQNTQYQVGLTDSTNVTDLCADIPYVMTIENIGSTTGYNTKVILNLPIGMSVAPGTCKIKYPHKGSLSSISEPVLKSGTTYEWNLSALQTGLANGFKGVSDTNRNKIIIYFRVKTSCDYSSGNYIRASASGNIKCGDPVLVYPAISNPLNIKGVSRPYYTLLKVEADTIFPCQKPGLVKVKIINLGPGKTGIEDKYQMLLPPGAHYDSSSYQGAYNAPVDSLTKQKDINGATELEFSLKDSILPGDSMFFTYRITADGNLVNCGPLDLYSQTAVKQEVTCVEDNSKCKINVATGNSLIKTPVLKGSLSFTALKTNIIKIDSDSETLNISYRISNLGERIGSNDMIRYKLAYDVDASGTVNNVDEILFIDTLSTTLDMGGFRDVSKTVKIKAGKSCALFIAVDSSSCSCDFGYSKFPVPELRNAGNDQSLCSGDTFRPGETTVKGFRYQWAPGGEFNSDTISSPIARLVNNDTAGISKTYVLTTYRGQCYSKDTVVAEIYKLPQIGLLQKDTNLCEGNSFLLKAFSIGGTGAHQFNWSPASILDDSAAYSTICKPLKDEWIFARVTDQKGCKALDSLKVEVHGKPNAKFVNNKACMGLPMFLMDSSSVSKDSINAIRWTAFGYDTLDIKTWELDFMGNSDVTVRLIVGTNRGCQDTMTRSLSLSPYPVSSFSWKDVCKYDSMMFTNNSTLSAGNIVRSRWQFGDGDSADVTNPAHIYQQPDTFEVRLMSISDDNCSDTFKRQVQVFNQPNADFTFTDNCIGDSSFIFNQSAVALGTITFNEWQTDGQTITSKDLGIKYDTDSLYNIQLKVVSDKGCKDSFSKSIRIHSRPVADFYTDTVCEGATTSIIGTSSIRNGYISSYKYDVSDGSGSVDSSFKHLFTSGDTFSIRLICNSVFGCSDTLDKEVIVLPRIVPDFTFGDVCLYDSAIINDKSSYSNTLISSWRYYFGDGDSVSQSSVTHKYKTPGTYTIKLLTVSSENCSYDTTKDIVIHPVPISDYSEVNKCQDNQFEFEDLSGISAGILTAYLWDFGDGDTSMAKDPAHAYDSAGKYRVSHVTISDKGCLDTMTRFIEAYPPVVVDFDLSDMCDGEAVKFTDRSKVPNSSIKLYKWDFGDGQGSGESDPVHLYAGPGDYNVNLSIRTGYDCDYDSSKMLTIFPRPSAMFSTDPDIGTIVNPEISIQDMSTGADTIHYDLGNGLSSQMRNLSSLYPDSGTFYIRQIASNSYGCKDTFVKKIVIRYLYVFNIPTAFSPNGDAYNDVFEPGGIGYSEYELWVYNRWGELVFHTDKGESWDGNSNGEALMQDIYLVKFKVKDFKGRYHYYGATVTLLR